MGGAGSQGSLSLSISKALERGCVQQIREQEEEPGGRNPARKAALNVVFSFFKEALVPRRVMLGGWQWMGQLSPVPTVPWREPGMVVCLGHRRFSSVNSFQLALRNLKQG